MTQLLNRLISVTGESTVTEHEDTRYTYGREGSVDVGPGTWYVFRNDRFVGLGPNAGVTQASHFVPILNDVDAGLTLFVSYYLKGDRTSGVVVTFPSVLDNEVPLTMRIHGPTDADYIEATVERVGRWRNYLREQLGWNLHIREGSVTRRGADFPVAPSRVAADALAFSFVGRGSEQPVSEATKNVWAQLSERGADVGLVVGEYDVGEGAQERIEATIRYDPDIAIAKNFTDDLGRRWFAVSTRTTGNRRWLVIEGVRHITGIDLPEFAAGQ